MKRLKSKLLSMDPKTDTYKEMYEGKEIIPPGTEGNPGDFAEIQYDTTYWHEDISVNIEETNKLSKDKPTLTWHIPTEKLGFEGRGEGISSHAVVLLHATERPIED